jgi:enoyl-CoA hydratase/carnithine racemase
MTDLEADPSVKVVVFQSANPDLFIAHLDVSKAAEPPELLGLWRECVLRPSSTPLRASPRFAAARAASVTSSC